MDRAAELCLQRRQDQTLAGETFMWLERTDARVSAQTDRTVCLLGQNASDVCLWSKQELLGLEEVLGRL